jgi:hypothetical protein
MFHMKTRGAKLKRIIYLYCIFNIKARYTVSSHNCFKRTIRRHRRGHQNLPALWESWLRKSRYFGCGKSPCGNARSHSIFLIHRDPLERLFSDAKTTLVGWPSDSESRATGFDSRLAQVTCWSCWGHFRVTFWSCRGHLFIDVGMSWDVFGNTLRVLIINKSRTNHEQILK